MAILIRYAPPGATTAQYDQVSEKVRATLAWPPDGLIAHVAWAADGQLRVSEVWESQEKLEAFQQGLMPLLQEAGINVEGDQPEMFEIHAAESQEYSTAN